MAQRELYKTKLCALHARGGCPRANCTFAHGLHELRHGPPGGLDRYVGYRGGDLRERIERRRSPPDLRRRVDSRRIVPRTRGRSQSPSPRAARHRSSDSPPLSSERAERRENKEAKRPRRDTSEPPSEDVSGSERGKDSLDRQDPAKANPAKRKGDSVEGEELEKEKRLLEAEILNLNETRKLLEEKVERKGRGVKELTNRVAELEANIKQIQEDSQSEIVKLKKLIKAHQRVVRAQDDLKKFQNKLNKLVDELPSGGAQDPDSKNTTNNVDTKGQGTPSALVEIEVPVNGSISGNNGRQEIQGKKNRSDDLAVDLNKGPPDSGLELNGVDPSKDERVVENPCHKRGESSEPEGGDHFHQEGDGGEQKEETNRFAKTRSSKDIEIENAQQEKETAVKVRELENSTREDSNLSVGREADGTDSMNMDRNHDSKMVDEDEEVDVLGDEGID